MAEKDKQPQQADFDKAWENIKAGKTMPQENDMGPLPKRTGLILTSPDELEKQRVKDVMERVKPGSPLVIEAKRRYEESLKQPPIEYKKKGGMIKKYKSGGSVSSASKRADGCATKGKTKGRII